jgi:hypothetical protein
LSSAIGLSYKGATGTAELKAEFESALDVDIDIATSWSWGVPRPEVKSFSAAVTVEPTIEGKVEVTGEIASAEYKRALPSIRFTPVTIMVGPVPVVVVPTMDPAFTATIGLSAKASVAWQASFPMKAGVQYSDGSWRPVHEIAASTAVTPAGEVALKSEVGLEVDAVLGLYGAVGPEVSITPSVAFEVQRELGSPAAHWKLTAGVEGNVGAKVSLLGRELGEALFPLLTYERTLGEGDIPGGTPTPTATPTPTTTPTVSPTPTSTPTPTPEPGVMACWVDGVSVAPVRWPLDPTTAVTHTLTAPVQVDGSSAASATYSFSEGPAIGPWGGPVRPSVEWRVTRAGADGLLDTSDDDSYTATTSAEPLVLDEGAVLPGMSFTLEVSAAGPDLVRIEAVSLVLTGTVSGLTERCNANVIGQDSTSGPWGSPVTMRSAVVRIGATLAVAAITGQIGGVTDTARNGDAVFVTGLGWPTDATPSATVGLGIFGGVQVDASNLTIDASGALSGWIRVPPTVGVGVSRLRVTAGAESADVPLLVLGQPVLTVSPASAEVGSQVAVGGSNWDPGATVQVLLCSAPLNCTPEATVTVSRGGSFTTTVTIRSADVTYVRAVAARTPGSIFSTLDVTVPFATTT